MKRLLISILTEYSRADVSDSMIHPTEKIVQAVAFTYERKHWQIIDESIADDFAYLKTVADGDVKVVSRTLDDSYWMVAYNMDDGPLRYYRYDREEKKQSSCSRMIRHWRICIWQRCIRQSSSHVMVWIWSSTTRCR